MVKQFFLFLLLFSGVSLCTQAQNGENHHKFDMRFGVGVSLLGTGDYVALNFSNELNYRLSRYFTAAVSVQYGRSGGQEKSRGGFSSSSFVGGNVNLFLSPFTNIQKNDFRLGGGFSYYGVSDVFLPGKGAISYTAEKRASLGFNVIAEDTFMVSQRLMLGVKLFMQPYTNGDINSGLLFKLGVVL